MPTHREDTGLAITAGLFAELDKDDTIMLDLSTLVFQVAEKVSDLEARVVALEP